VNFKIQKIGEKYSHEARLFVYLSEEREHVSLRLTHSEMLRLSDTIGNFLECQRTYDFTQEVNGHTYMYNVNGGEPESHDCPGEAAHIEDLAIVINGIAIPFDDDIEDLDGELMDLAWSSMEADVEP